MHHADGPGLDTGPVWACEELPIDEDETTGDLTGRLAQAGAGLLVRTLDAIDAGMLREPTPQKESGATHAPKLTPEDVALSWTIPATELHRRVMAGNPWPGAQVQTGRGPLKVWRSRAVEAEADATPSSVLCVEPELIVAASAGALALLEVQAAGKDRMHGREFAHGRRLAPGDTL